MNNMKMLINRLVKGKNKLEINIQDRLPLDSLTIQINGVTHLVLVIGTIDYDRRVVVTDLKGNIIKEITKITEVEGDDIHLAKDNENIYITKSISNYSSISKCSLQNLAIRARHEFPGTNFTDIIVDDLYIYVYDVDNGRIIKLDKRFNLVEEIDIKVYQGKNTSSWCDIELATTKDGYISINCTPYKDETEYFEFKAFLRSKFGKNIMFSNDHISSIAYDHNKDRLYVAMYNFICIIENGLCNSFLYFPKKGITSIYYDGDLSLLNVCYSNLKEDSIDGSVRLMSDNEIKDERITIAPFKLFSEGDAMFKRSEGNQLLRKPLRK